MTIFTSADRAEFSGRLVLPGDADFEEARVGRVFNARRPDRSPEAVLLAETEADVTAGVRLARERGVAVAVRSGGHSWAVWSVREGTLLIELGLLREIDYDEETGIVSASPAIQGGSELDPFLAERGRFFNGGHCPTVGIGGFLLQGGQGWCARGWGWAAEHIVALDVVTAEGEIVRCDADKNTDLYWAARGAGPTFPGVVTRFHLQTRPRFEYIGHTVQVFPIDAYEDVMSWVYSIHAEVDQDVEIVCVSRTDEVPGHERQRTLVVSALALVDTAERADEVLAPFRGNPHLDRALAVQDAAESSMEVQRESQLQDNPEDHRYVVDNLWVVGTDAEQVDGLAPLFTDLPNDKSFTVWISMAPLRELPDMAFSLQSEAYTATYMCYEDSSKDAEYRQWLNEQLSRAQPITLGQYLGDSDMTNRQLRVKSDENWNRLQQIIAERDPNGTFVRYLAHDEATLNANHWQLAAG
jgi:FAD/FMN-containing dehydrogenase